MLDMINEKTSVEQTNTTDNTELNDSNMFDENGGVLETLTTLSASVVEWRELQCKADDKLYSVLDGCLRVMYLCENEDLKATLLSVCTDKDMKGMDNKGVHLIVSKLVFGSKDKKCYTYAKALENASKLQLNTEKDKRKLSEYLKTNGGIDVLIRKEAIAISKDYDDERFGTKEHFGETMCTEMFGYHSGMSLCGGLKAKDKESISGLSGIKIANTEFQSCFKDKDKWEQFAKIKYDYETKTFAIIPFTVSQQEGEYKAIAKAFNKFVARAFEGSTMWNKYIDMCDKRNEKLKQKKAEDEKKMLKELSKIKL
jgi:hypothetical protein